MADPKRLRTLMALTEHLRTEVTLANGYQHDLSGAVFRGKLLFDESDPLPSVSLLESPDPDRAPVLAGYHDRVDAPQSNEEWMLLLQGWAVDDKVNPTDPAYRLMADVRKALAKILQGDDPMSGRQAHPSYMLGGLIEGMTMEPGVARPPQEGVSSRAFFWMRVKLKFVEDQNDPYAD